MNRAAIRIALIFLVCAGISSCGSSGSPGGQQTSNLPFRAFVSNPLQPSLGSSTPVLNIVDATHDVESVFRVNLSGTQNPGLMAVSPNLAFTMVFDSGTNAIALIDNSREGPAVGPSGMNLPFIPLPGPTESIFVASDNGTGYAAVPTAPQSNPQLPPGGVIAMSLASASIAANVPVAGVRFVTGSHNGNRVLAFADNSNQVVVIAPTLVGTTTDPRTFVCCFDHPVWGVFSSDDTKAFILSCGAECSGASASVTVLDLTTNTAGVAVPVPAATYGLLNGNTLYVAGTAPGTPCPSGTPVSSCGTLTVLDVSGALPAVTNSAPIAIADGYHNRMEMGANGQLFIGSTNCSNAVGQRGCLTIFNTATSAVVVPPANGDVTGIAPVTGRSVVYVCEGGVFYIYDTTSDQLEVLQTPVKVVGMAVDVKVVDP